MSPLVLLVSTQLVLTSACTSRRPPPFVCEKSSPVSGYGELARASNTFLIDLVHTLEEPSKNIIISPFSIFTGLSLLHLGAGGRTKDNFEAALHYPEKGERIHSEGRGVLTALDKLSSSANETFILQTSNKVFLDNSFSVTPDYRSKVECFYQSELTSLPLRLDPTVSAEKINSWISEKTHGRIERLVSPQLLGRDSQAVLVNSVYFKAPWDFGKFPFVEDRTFTRENGENISVEMMSSQGSFPLGRIQDMGTVVRLDYKTCLHCPRDSADMALLVFLPDVNTSWASWQREVLRPDVISGASLQLEEEPVKLSLPKFEIKYEKNLSPTLRKLKLDLDGDFSGLSESNLAVSEVLTKTFLRVDENGSEGAAATAIIMGRSMMIPRNSLVVERTFMVSIVHKSSGLVVFAGKIDDPHLG